MKKETALQKAADPEEIRPDGGDNPARHYSGGEEKNTAPPTAGKTGADFVFESGGDKYTLERKKDAQNGDFTFTAYRNRETLKRGAPVVYVCTEENAAMALWGSGRESVYMKAGSEEITAGAMLQQLAEAPEGTAFIICPKNEADPERDEQAKQAARDICAGIRQQGARAIIYNVAGPYHDIDGAISADPDGTMKRIHEAEEELRRDDITAFLQKIQTEAYKPHRTGLKFFDDLLQGGVINQSLLLLLAAPGAGKTTLCAQLAESMARNRTPVIYFNLEMSREQMIAKAISARLFRNGYGKTALQILQGYKWTERDREEIAQAAAEYQRESLPFIRYNPDDVGGDLAELLQYLGAVGEAARTAGRPAPAVIVDYLHLISSRDRIEPAELIKKTVVGLKHYAVKYDTFVIAIAATNRASNAGGRLTMESGRDSSSIEYTADYQLSLNYYAVDSGDIDPKDVDALAQLQQQERREMILRVLKGRLITPGRAARVLYNAAYNTFYGAADDFQPPEGFIADDGQIAFDDPLPETMPAVTLRY